MTDQNRNEVELPPLPVSYHEMTHENDPFCKEIDGYTADQMREYGRACVAAVEQAKREGVAYAKQSDLEKLAKHHYGMPVFLCHLGGPGWVPLTVAHNAPMAGPEIDAMIDKTLLRAARSAIGEKP